MTAHGRGPAVSAFERAVGAVIASVPAGEVISYGEVAAEAGYPGAARAVGSFLGRHDGYPWWRVVTASGRLVPGEEARQEMLLAAEGIVVVDGHVHADGDPRDPRPGRPGPYPGRGA